MAFLSRKTFDYRRTVMRNMMQANGLDALAFLTPDFFQWATNFHVDVQTWERPIAVVVPLDGEPFALMNELSTNHLRGRLEHGVMWVSDVTIWSEHPRLGGRVPVRAQWAETLGDLLQQKGLARARLGVDAAGGPLARVPALLPDLRLVPSVTAMREMRFVKCDEELRVHRDAGREQPRRYHPVTNCWFVSRDPDRSTVRRTSAIERDPRQPLTRQRHYPRGDRRCRRWRASCGRGSNRES